jgi:hypothetical protein
MIVEYTDNVLTPQQLFDQGYRQVSRKYGEVARVDITDEELVKLYIKRNYEDKTSGLPCLSLEDQKDYYRRCASKDLIKHVPEVILRELNRLVSEVINKEDNSCKFCGGKGYHTQMFGFHSKGDFFGDKDIDVPPSIHKIACSKCNLNNKLGISGIQKTIYG